MSYEDGWAAVNLEMPKRIPRTEYSAEGHWDLIKAVTGIDVGVDSLSEVKSEAQLAFVRAWNYDFFWSTLIRHAEFGDLSTDMGHAESPVPGREGLVAKTLGVGLTAVLDRVRTLRRRDRVGRTGLYLQRTLAPEESFGDVYRQLARRRPPLRRRMRM